MNALVSKTLESMLGLILIALLVSPLMQCSVSQEILNLNIHTPDLQQSKDGNYVGQYESKMVKAEVMVKINNHSIEDIDIINHETGLGKKAEVLVDSVLVHQTIELDAISGATVSSKVILKSIESAIHKSIN
jgi:uncharacterized protein with FMN-binding domain